MIKYKIMKSALREIPSVRLFIYVNLSERKKRPINGLSKFL